MMLAHAWSQSGGYRYFPDAVARQLQRSLGSWRASASQQSRGVARLVVLLTLDERPNGHLAHTLPREAPCTTGCDAPTRDTRR